MNILLETGSLTADDLLGMGEAGKGFELIDGQLVEQHVSVLSCLVSGAIHALLYAHCLANRLGWVFPQESGFQYDPNAPKKVRKPDAAFIRKDRLPESELPAGYCHIVPDLAVEVVSPNDTFDEVDVKVEEYLDLGVKLVWVVSLRTRQVYVHRADGTMSKVREGEDLLGEDVVPGFRCRVGDLFPVGTDVTPTNGSAS
ncbi:MAG TPA: Uma2 family endonuclease [Gemmataceae bacterium]|nr:Uma2 family endonuclease [Gemmataceae bacterium]